MSFARLGLPRCRRLCKPSEYAAVAQGEYRTRDRYFGLRARTNGMLHARLGISVSRRVSLKAIVRNRIKRQIRDSFRLHQTALGGVDVVVVAYTPVSEAPRVDLRQSLKQHWETIANQCRRS